MTHPECWENLCLLSQGLLRLTGWRTGILATSVWMAAILCWCVRPASSLQTCPSPLTWFTLSCLKAHPLSRSYRYAWHSLASSCFWMPSVHFITAVLSWQKGTVYLLNYEILDGVPANMVNGEQTYLCAPLCLLHLNQQGQLLPIAIQVSSF